MSVDKCQLLFTILSIALCSANEDEKAKGDRSDYKKALYKECATSYSVTCLKLDIVSWVDKLNKNDDFSVLPGVSVIKDNNSDTSNTSDIVVEVARAFPNDPEARLDAFLMRKVTGYLSSHSLKLNLWNANSLGEARGKGGGFGGGKKGGGLEYLLAAGAMMKGTLMAVAMGGLAAIAGKALMTAMISLMLSAIVGLKSLSGGHKSTTYEVVAKPIYTHSNSHSTSHEDHGHYGHSSYGRSLDVPLPVGLQPDYKPAA